MLTSFEKSEKILLLSVAKWLILATVTGILVGGVVGGFLLLLFRSISFVAALPPWKGALIPVGMIISVFSVVKFCPAAAGHGTDKVIAAIHKKWGRIPDAVVPVKIIATLATLSVGGVVGTEGPSTQIGGALMSWFSDRIKCTEHERKKLVVCGVAAALAAVFGAPVAGAVFGIEMLFVGEMFYRALLPAVIAGVSSYYVCLLLGVPYAVPVPAVPELSAVTALWCAAAGVFFAFVSIFHVECFNAVEKGYARTHLSVWNKALLSSVILVGIALWSGETYLGMGDRGFYAAVSGEKVVWYAFALKSFLLAVTLGGGGSGGVLTPTFYVGAAAGALFAGIFGLDVGFFAALGFAGLIAGSVNTPLAALILSMELFGSEIAPFAAIVCVFSYMLSGDRSLYPSQILARPKSDEFVRLPSDSEDVWITRPKKR